MLAWAISPKYNFLHPCYPSDDDHPRRIGNFDIFAGLPKAHCDLAPCDTKKHKRASDDSDAQKWRRRESNTDSASRNHLAAKMVNLRLSNPRPCPISDPSGEREADLHVLMR